MIAAGDESLEVVWCDVTRDSANDIARALVDLADDLGASSVRAVIPSTAWTDTAFEEAGYQLHRIRIYAMGLPRA